jgi:hypothetical protein
VNQARHFINWPELLVDCTIGLCVGLISGLLLPFTPIARTVLLNVFASQPGQSGAIGGIVGILIGALFFFSKSTAIENEKTHRRTSVQKGSDAVYTTGFVNDHAISFVSAILILTVVVQVILVKSWT